MELGDIGSALKLSNAEGRNQIKNDGELLVENADKREGLFQAHLLQPGGKRWPLHGMGTASNFYPGSPRSVQITPLISPKEDHRNPEQTYC
jgi:hypothetical protein